MPSASNIAWQFERVSFPLNLAVNTFFHRVRSVDVHYHTAFELLLVLSGQIAVFTGGKERSMTAGDIALIHGGEPHATHDGLGQQNLVLALQIDPAIARHDLDFTARRFDMDAFFSQSNASSTLNEMWMLAGQIVCETRMKRLAWQMEVESLLLRLIAVLVRQVPSRITQAEEQLALMPDEISALNAQLSRVVSYIQQHADEDISISDVSQTLGLSCGYFSRLFKQKTGESFGQFLTQIRLRKSLKLLSVSEPANITDIAFACGFPNIKAFNLAFKRALNSTPGEWRKQQLTKACEHKTARASPDGYFVPDDSEAMRLLYQMMDSKSAAL